MNLNHLEAIAVTQKLSYSLDDKDYDAVDVLIIPPFTDIRSVQTLIDGDRLRLVYGAQDLSPEVSGAFTGDISGSMHNESDEIVNRKIKAALANEITPLLCIGEELEIRESGSHVAHVLNQLRSALKGFHKPDLKKIVFAYEPVWAIGTGKTATPADAQEVCSAIRVELEKIAGADIAQSARILYGGSVKSSNIIEIMAEADVDGVLVGGASLDADEFARIAKFYRSVPVSPTAPAGN